MALAVVAIVAGIGLHRIGDGPSPPARTPVAQTPPGVTPPPATAPLVSDRPITVTAVGDLVMGSPPYGMPSDGGASLFTAVKPLLTGDVVLANLEGTLSAVSGSKCGTPPSPNCFAFQTPPESARWLREAGITDVNLANNHSFDFGAAGRDETVQALQRARVRWTGVPEGSITYGQAQGNTVALIGFGFNDGMNSVLDLPRARAIVAEAARHAPMVIVTMHAGAEGADAQHVRSGDEIFLGEDRGNPVRFARAMVDAGADLVIGHGPHVMRALEVRKGRLIAYSLGNFMGYAVFNTTGPSGESAVLSVRLGADGRLLGGRMTSLALVGKGVPTPGGSTVDRVRRLTAADLGTRGAVIDADGVIAAPPASE